ncbi:unnamed protein product [Diamesa tonsa]
MQHKPLDKFRQCGPLTMLFAVFIVLFGVSSTALTTFGINKNTNQPGAPTPAPRGKECNTNTDCVGIQDTSCVKDYDQKLRCLCGDYRAPVNGYCSTKDKGLRHQCGDTDDCEDYMICRADNATKTTLAKGVKDYSMKEKLCLCDEDNGYMENVVDKHCSAAVQNFVTGVVSYFAALLFYFVVTQKVLTY